MVGAFAWHTNPKGYVETSINNKGRKLRMHRLILGVHNQSGAVQIDHINLDKLDNRKANLRLCTNSQNHQNRPPREGYSSIYKGVSWQKKCGKWRAAIKVNGKSRYLGQFADEADAARAYDRAALEHFGEFAWLNFPLEVKA